MRLKIVNTTNGQFLGYEFEDAYPVQLPNGSIFFPEHIIVLPSGNYRLVTSNFIIDAKEV